MADLSSDSCDNCGYCRHKEREAVTKCHKLRTLTRKRTQSGLKYHKLSGYIECMIKSQRAFDVSDYHSLLMALHRSFTLANPQY